MDMFTLRFFYNPDYIAKSLELIDVTSQFIVTMDTSNEPDMLLHTGADSFLKFYQCRK